MSRAALCLLLALLCTVARAHALPGAGAFTAGSVDFEQHLGAQIPLSLEFEDESGRRAALAARFHRVPVVLVLGYFGCTDLCSTVLGGTAEALDRAGLRAGRDYAALFASIDPHDTPRGAAAKRSELPRDVRASWHFLNGTEAAASQLAERVGYRYVYDADTRQYAHPTGFVVVAPSGRIAKYFLGVRFDPAAVGRAVADAAREETGEPAEPLLLRCFHDLTSPGKNSGAVWAAIRTAMGALVAALAYLLWRLRRRERDAGKRR